MNKILALDLGDEWTGIAITDALKMFARPCCTVKTSELVNKLYDLINLESVNEIIVGYPITLAGKESRQTHKVIAQKDELQKLLPDIQFTLWDERLSSKRAGELSNAKKIKNKEEKLKEHARAAAFILDSYLNYLKNKTQE